MLAVSGRTGGCLTHRGLHFRFQQYRISVQRYPLLYAVLVALLAFLSLDAVHAKYGDRPGQLRDSAFSSLGRHGKKSSNDPRMWPDKYKKSKDCLLYTSPSPRDA